MSSWLYAQITAETPGRAPRFAEQSTQNWFQALAYEVTNEHGSSTAEQLRACRRAVKSQPPVSGTALPAGAIFELLFGAVANAMALTTLANDSRSVTWHRPAAVVTWYYAVYGSIRSMFAVAGQPVAENHSAAMRTYVSLLRQRMPHPFDMVARHHKAEEYELLLPLYPETQKYDLKLSFTPSAHAARGMLLQYLGGTADWYTDRTKERLKRQHKITSFHRQQAKDLRDKTLETQIGFMHAAFRIRGKANYRDAMFLTYGARELSVSPDFIVSLATTARFVTLAALAFAERQIGVESVRNFVADMQANIRGIAQATPDETYWTAALSE